MDQIYQIPTTIVTTNYNLNYPDIYKFYLDNGFTTKHIKYDNMYDFLSGYTLYHPILSRFKKQPVVIETPIEVNGYRVKQDKKKPNVYRYYKDEVYCFYRQYYPKTKILKIEDTMSACSTKKIERKEYNQHGYLHRITYFHPIQFYKLQETFYTSQGYLYLKIFYENEKAVLINHYDEQGNIINAFENIKSLHAYYFKSIFKNGDIVFNDARLLDVGLSKVNKALKKYNVLHSSHLLNGKLKNSFEFVLKNADYFDGYIVLTDAQKQDIKASFNVEDEKLIHIPHGEPQINDFEHLRNPKQICYVGRYEPEKRIEDMIHALSIVKAKGHYFTFVMYGMGDQEYIDKIKRLIGELNLNNEIQINDFTEHPKEVFAESIMSLNTSKYEGFGLSIMESINQHCPVISYDIKYGPKELIVDDVNGYLVEEGNIEQFAKSIIKAIHHQLYKTTYLNDKYTEANMIKAYAEII